MIRNSLIQKVCLLRSKTFFCSRVCPQWLRFAGIGAFFVWVSPSLVLSGPTDSVKNVNPAKVEQIANEINFNTITLTARAEQRLNIQTVAIERRKVHKTQLYGGELILPLTPSHSGKSKNLLEGKQSVSTILSLMTPADQIRVAEAQVNADGEVQAAKVQVEAAQIASARARRLLRDRAGSRKDVDEANAQFQLAQSTLAQAQARRRLLGPTLLATTPPDRFWVRVPVFVGALASLDLQQSAQVGPLTNRPEETRFFAQPVFSPPSSNPKAATVDLFYQMVHPHNGWQLGRKVGIALPLKLSQESLIAPWSAVVFDIYGGTWVYENTALYTYVRRRVQVSFILQSDAVLASGPKPGTKIVAQGAAELFGTEVGFGK